MRERVTVRGIELQAVENVEFFANRLLNEQGVRYGRLVAINAEKVIAYEQNPLLRRLIDEAEFKYADGISIVWAVRKKYPQYELERIAGVDLWQTLMQKAARQQLPVFLIGSSPETLNIVKTKLAARRVKIVGSQHGYFAAEEEPAVIERIARSGAKLVTVAMGSPKQEMLIQNAYRRYPQALYMGVGGSYEVFAGKVKRAPKTWRKLGLEWLYRLLTQPTRWRRQLNLLKFACYYLSNRL